LASRGQSRCEDRLCEDRLCEAIGFLMTEAL